MRVSDVYATFSGIGPIAIGVGIGPAHSHPGRQTYDDHDEGTLMAEKYDTPWFDALSDDDAVLYISSGEQLVGDLRTAATFMNDIANMCAFPVRSYQPEVDLQYFVQESDADPRGTFEALARNVVAAGGSTFDRSDVEHGTVQHNAELRFGSGRVAYRVVWIERTPTDG